MVICSRKRRSRYFQMDAGSIHFVAFLLFDQLLSDTHFIPRCFLSTYKWYKFYLGCTLKQFGTAKTYLKESDNSCQSSIELDKHYFPMTVGTDPSVLPTAASCYVAAYFYLKISAFYKTSIFAFTEELLLQILFASWDPRNGRDLISTPLKNFSPKYMLGIVLNKQIVRRWQSPSTLQDRESYTT